MAKFAIITGGGYDLVVAADEPQIAAATQELRGLRCFYASTAVAGASPAARPAA